MMKSVTEKMEEFPETPQWTMFFDGPLFQKYDEFMKTKDFSKILINTKLRLANSHNPESVSSTHTIAEDYWDKEQEVDPTGNTYQYMSADYFQRNKEDEKRRAQRTQRTRAFIILGFIIMAVLAFGTALVIHYFLTPSFEERNPKTFVNVSFAVNNTASVIPGALETSTKPLQHSHHPTYSNTGVKSQAQNKIGRSTRNKLSQQMDDLKIANNISGFTSKLKSDSAPSAVSK